MQVDTPVAAKRMQYRNRMDQSDPLKVEKATCSATSKQTGKRCGRYPIPGGKVCKFHGGAAPQVIAKAKDRLAALVDPAITELTRLMSDSDIDAIRLAVARDILDRTGHKPTDKIEVTDVNRRLEQLQAGRERARKALEGGDVVDVTPEHE